MYFVTMRRYILPTWWNIFVLPMKKILSASPLSHHDMPPPIPSITSWHVSWEKISFFWFGLSLYKQTFWQNNKNASLQNVQDTGWSSKTSSAPMHCGKMPIAEAFSKGINHSKITFENLEILKCQLSDGRILYCICVGFCLFVANVCLLCFFTVLDRAHPISKCQYLLVIERVSNWVSQLWRIVIGGLSDLRHFHT